MSSRRRTGRGRYPQSEPFRLGWLGWLYGLAVAGGAVTVLVMSGASLLHAMFAVVLCFAVAFQLCYAAMVRSQRPRRRPARR